MGYSRVLLWSRLILILDFAAFREQMTVNVECFYGFAFIFAQVWKKVLRNLHESINQLRYASRSLLYNFPFMCALLSTRGFNFQPCDIVKIAVGIL